MARKPMATRRKGKKKRKIKIIRRPEEQAIINAQRAVMFRNRALLTMAAVVAVFVGANTMFKGPSTDAPHDQAEETGLSEDFSNVAVKADLKLDAEIRSRVGIPDNVPRADLPPETTSQDDREYRRVLESSIRYYTTRFRTPEGDIGLEPEFYQQLMEAAHDVGCDAPAMIKLVETESHFRLDVRTKTTDVMGISQAAESTWLGYIRDHAYDMGLPQYDGKVQWRDTNRVGSYVTGADGKKVWKGDAALRDEMLDLRSNPYYSMRFACLYATANADIVRNGVRRGDGYKTYVAGGGAKVQLKPLGYFNRTMLKIAHFFDGEPALAFAHFAGRNPSHAAADYFPAQAASNRTIFYHLDDKGGIRDKKSFQQVMDHFENMMGAKFYRETPPRMVVDVNAVYNDAQDGILLADTRQKSSTASAPTMTTRN